jgi:hypothetical protein
MQTIAQAAHTKGRQALKTDPARELGWKSANNFYFCGFFSLTNSFSAWGPGKLHKKGCALEDMKPYRGLDANV